MRRALKLLRLRNLCAALSALLTLQVWAAENPKSLLEDSDRARGGISTGVSWEVKIDSTEDGSSSSTSYRVRTKGTNAFVEVTAPARNKGEVFLFNDRTIWFFKPSLKKPVAISARQKLSGQTANGDIASTNYARDYSGTITGEETVDGENCVVLQLKSVGENTTYDSIKYWVSKSRHLGVKAEFQSLQGKPLKRASFKYGNKIKVNGKYIDFVATVTIADANNAKNQSVLSYSAPKVEAAPDSLFNVNNLLR